MICYKTIYLNESNSELASMYYIVVSFNDSIVVDRSRYQTTYLNESTCELASKYDIASATI
jgi:hypothetical protein